MTSLLKLIHILFMVIAITSNPDFLNLMYDSFGALDLLPLALIPFLLAVLVERFLFLRRIALTLKLFSHHQPLSLFNYYLCLLLRGFPHTRLQYGWLVGPQLIITWPFVSYFVFLCLYWCFDWLNTCWTELNWTYRPDKTT